MLVEPGTFNDIEPALAALDGPRRYKQNRQLIVSPAADYP